LNKEKKIIGIFVIIAVILVAGFITLFQFSSPKIYGNKGGSTGEVSRYVSRDIPMTDSNGSTRKLMDLKGKVWLISHVFTRCPGQCAGVCVVLDEIRKDVNDKDNLHFVSVTLDPNHDTPDHLKKFSKKHGFVSDDWWFLTGESSELNRYMMEVFSLAAQEKKESEKVSEDDIFAHKPMVALINHELKIEGWYNPFDKRSSEALREKLLFALNEAKS
jgi:protein SCO1/2